MHHHIIHAAFTAFLNALPTVNFTVFAAAICISSPVAGLRPTRAARAPLTNVPKPTSCTGSPFATALQAHHEAVHQLHQPWGVSLAQVIEQIAALGQQRPVPRSHALISRWEALADNADVARRPEIADPAQTLAGLGAGADDVLPSRDERDMLLVRVRSILRRKLARDDEAAGAERAAAPQLIEGVELTLRELQNVFSRHGIRVISPAPGDRFDPQSHEAMFEAAVPGTVAGHIIQVMDNGFMLHDRLLRPAKVGVSSTPAS